MKQKYTADAKYMRAYCRACVADKRQLSETNVFEVGWKSFSILFDVGDFVFFF